MRRLTLCLAFLGCTAEAATLGPEPNVSFEIAVAAHGAIPNDGIDDVPGIQAAIDEAQANGGGRVVLEAGRYDLASATARLGLILLDGYSNISIVGEGAGVTVLRHVDGLAIQNQTRILTLTGSSHISLSDFTIDGNRHNVTYNGQEQDHGLNIRESNHVRVDRMEFVRTGGDGIQIMGNTTPAVKWTEDFWITNSKFTDNGRSGIAIQRDIRRGVISGNIMTAIDGQPIDFEPTGCTRPSEDILISDNVLLGGVFSVGGCDPSTPATRVIVTNNVIDSWVRLMRTRDSKFIGNDVRNAGSGIALEVRASNDGLIVAQNTITQNAPTHALAIFSTNGSPDWPEHVTIQSNVIVNAGATSAGHFGVYLIGVGKDIRILDNEIRGNGIAGDGIRARQHIVPFPMEGLVISGNTIRGFASRGILIVATSGGVISDFRVTDNFIDDVPTGIEQSAITGTIQRGFISGNTFGPNVTTQVKP